MKIFISYGHLVDQVTALRLQALGAVNGLNIYVPPAYTRNAINPLFDEESHRKLIDCDFVLSVIGHGISDACMQELRVAADQNKRMIVMATPAFSQQLQPLFGANLVLMDPMNPGASEQAMVAHLKTLAMNAQNQNAAKSILGLGVLALGLVLLAAASNRD